MTRGGLYFAAVQFLFVTCWTVYVIFLPQLAAQAGIEKKWVIYILMAAQAIFTLMDFSMGVAADRVQRVLGRLGRLLVILTAVSCAAFLLLPLAAPAGSPVLFLALIVIWAMTSSALRAPPMALLGKYVPKPKLPWVSTLTLLGMGIAGAGAPYLTASLRGVDPRLPFALSSVALIVAVSAMLWAEKHLAGTGANAAPEAVEKKPVGTGVVLFFGAVALLGLGFQAHFALNSAPLYLRFAKPAELDYLMPVFWIGFNLLIFPACRANERFGGTAVMAAGAVSGALASALAAAAPSLESLLVLQFLAGGAWAAVLMSAMTAAISIGHVGCEGAATGGLFALLAFATFTRMGLVAAQLNQDPVVSALLVWLPGLAWMVAGLLLAWLTLRVRAPAAESAQASS
ncbi:MAG: MFS transporter [Betaproteobacteria bacterium]|nr:MFS transporter [Betaproteobacteria bacterium]